MSVHLNHCKGMWKADKERYNEARKLEVIDIDFTVIGKLECASLIVFIGICFVNLGVFW